MQFNKMNTSPGNDFLTKTNPSSSTIQDEFWDDVSPPAFNETITKPSSYHSNEKLTQPIQNIQDDNKQEHIITINQVETSQSLIPSDNNNNNNKKKDENYLTFRSSNQPKQNQTIKQANKVSSTIPPKQQHNNNSMKLNTDIRGSYINKLNNLHNGKYSIDNRNDMFNRFLKKVNPVYSKKQNNEYINYNNNNKHPSRSVEQNKSTKRRIENLYEHARLKNMYLCQLQEQQKQNKLLEETRHCTFKPVTNKKIKAFVSSTKLNTSDDIYERSKEWEMNKRQKIQKEKNKMNEQKEEYSYMPMLTELKDGMFTEMNVTNNLSTVLFLERQEKARENKNYVDNYFNNKNKKGYTTPYKNKDKGISWVNDSIVQTVNNQKMLMEEYKAALHAELCENEEYSFNN